MQIKRLFVRLACVAFGVPVGLLIASQLHSYVGRFIVDLYMTSAAICGLVPLLIAEIIFANNDYDRDKQEWDAAYARLELEKKLVHDKSAELLTKIGASEEIKRRIQRIDEIFSTFRIARSQMSFLDRHMTLPEVQIIQELAELEKLMDESDLTVRPYLEKYLKEVYSKLMDNTPKDLN